MHDPAANPEIDRVRAGQLAWLAERRDAYSPAPQGREAFGARVMASFFQGSAAYGYGTNWSQNRYEQVLHYRHWNYVAVSICGDAVAAHPPNFGLVKSSGPKGNPRDNRSAAARRYLEHRHTKTMGALKPHEDVTPLDETHPLVRLFARPNNYDIAAAFWFELTLFLKLCGNTFVWVVPNKLGLPSELWVLPAQWVWPRTGNGRLVDGYEVRPYYGTGNLWFPPEEVIHIVDKSPVHKVDGWSRQQAGSEWIDITDRIEKSRYNIFENGAFNGGLGVNLNEKYVNPDDKTLERLYEKLNERIAGVKNAGKPLISPPGAQFVALPMPPMELPHNASADQIRDNTLALYRVPKDIAGVEPAGSNISRYAGEVQFCKWALNPNLRYYGQTFTEKLCNPYWPDTRMWWDDATPSDPAQLNADIATDYACQMITPNEGRALRGRPAYENGGDDPMAPGGIMPLPINTGEDVSDLLPPTPPPSAGFGGKPGKEDDDTVNEPANDRKDDRAAPVNVKRLSLVQEVKDVVAGVKDHESELAAALKSIAESQKATVAALIRSTELLGAAAAEAAGRTTSIENHLPQTKTVVNNQIAVESPTTNVAMTLALPGPAPANVHVENKVEAAAGPVVNVVVQPAEVKNEVNVSPTPVEAHIHIPPPQPMRRVITNDTDGNPVEVVDTPIKPPDEET